MQKLSRSKLELFLECPRCFWLDVKHKIKRPQPPPYTLNNAVDYLLKQEFDKYREAGKKHPLMEKHHIEAVPYQSPHIDVWRHNFTGIQHHHLPSGFLFYGAVDDIWVNPQGELIVVDYKATGANQHRIYDSYRRQMEIYQWLLRKNGFPVSRTGYFLFTRVNKGEGFGLGVPALPFDVFIEPLEGDDSWVEESLVSARRVLDQDAPPAASSECDYCTYRSHVNSILS
ncbi:hypothetical protein D6779_11835 [Candidatus Parcubacteria bacterium]|nr:MAG: hypothetical protein D6779_11835 [Candidatus Parcubacteria bacterium]